MELETRIKIWESVQKGIRNRDYWFLCLALKDENNLAGQMPIGFNEVLSIFPEILKHRPKYKRAKNGWWPLGPEGYKIRLAVCEDIISELKSKPCK